MLDRTQFLIKEHVGLLKVKGHYDILDPANGGKLGEAKEVISGWLVALRLLINKQLLPTTVEITDTVNGRLVVRLKRGFTLFRSKVWIETGEGTRLGYFRAKLFSLGGGFHVFGVDNQRCAEVKGDWKGWNFRFLTKEGEEIGTVSKKWAGLGKELLTSADNYMIALKEAGKDQAARNTLLLAAGIAIDTIYKEK